VWESCSAGLCVCLSLKLREYINETACTALANNATSAGDGVNGWKGIIFVDREHIWLPYSHAL